MPTDIRQSVYYAMDRKPANANPFEYGGRPNRTPSNAEDVPNGEERQETPERPDGLMRFDWTIEEAEGPSATDTDHGSVSVSDLGNDTHVEPREEAESGEFREFLRPSFKSTQPRLPFDFYSQDDAEGAEGKPS